MAAKVTIPALLQMKRLTGPARSNNLIRTGIFSDSASRECGQGNLREARPRVLRARWRWGSAAARPAHGRPRLGGARPWRATFQGISTPSVEDVFRCDQSSR